MKNMRIYNCMVVFNPEKDKILFCKRVKDPYLGLYNFVGGKVENGENHLDAAYRELREETGITSRQVRLHHMMDLTYYDQDFLLELYVCKLENMVELVEEVNPLVWLPITEDFADASRFAGEQNIAHIVNVAKKSPVYLEK